MNNFHAISISHKKVDLHLIGSLLPSFCCEIENYHQHLDKVKETYQFEEFFFLNTCNRILCIYISENPIEDYKQFFQTLNPENTKQTLASNQFDVLNGPEVISHLFRVCSGLNSMVVGEHEILGQVKKAYQSCRSQNWIGDNLRILFEYAIPYAKQVYHQTDIGKHTVSVVALAVGALRYIPEPQKKRVLILGAGESIQKTMRFLLKMGYEQVHIFNRTFEKAAVLAKQVAQGKAYQLAELKEYTEGFDILITCLDKNANFVDEPLYEQILAESKEKKIVIDLAVPNNIASAVAKSPQVDFIDIQSLKVTAKANLDKRKLSLSDAEIMIAQHEEDFALIHKKRQLERALSDIPIQMKQIKNHAIENVFQKDLNSADDETRALVEKVLAYVEKKYISIPMTIARDALLQEIGD